MKLVSATEVISAGPEGIILESVLEGYAEEILGVKMPCVDEGFGENTPVDIVIRPEDVELVPAEDGYMQGDVVSNIFKGVPAVPAHIRHCQRM